MLRAALIALLALAVLAPAAGARPKARATVTTCDRADQAAVFAGRMDSIPGTDRMQMRFKLQIRSPGSHRWTGVAVPGFSAWVTSLPGRSRYIYAKRVEGLLAPAAYRVQLRFRWLDSTGGVIRSARAASHACRQPDPRPDLVAADLRADGPSRYDVELRNAGHGSAAASTVQLRFPDGSTVSGSVPPMAPGGTEDVFLDGPACVPGQWVEVTADAGDAVDESDEANVFALPCPAL